MPNLIIDPYVFACPQPEEGIDEFRNYIESIISWREFRESGWTSVFITARTPEILAETNSYPPYDDLNKVISRLGVRDVQARDVIILINDLLQRLPTIEDRFAIEEVLIEDVRSEPSYHLSTRLPVFIEHYYRLVVFICLIIRFQNERGENQILITRHLKEESVESRVAGRIVAYECGHTVKIPTVCPFEIEGQFQLCNTPNGLYLTVDPVSLWVEAQGLEDYNKAIEVKLYQLHDISGQNNIEDEEDSEDTVEERSIMWTFNSHFFGTASEHGFLNQEGRIRSLLRACAETLLNINMRATHALREGKGAEEKQRKRGTDKAWRRDIDHEFHLHYWETSDGVEFASVVTHKDVTIPE